MTFNDKVVWITGASSGIGRHLALEFARQGAKVAVTARRMDLLDALVSEIKATCGDAKSFFCDVLTDASIQQCAQAINDHYGAIDVTVANAGFGVVGKVEELTEADWSRQLAGNVTGLALTCKYALPYLKLSKGRLCLLGSVGAFIPNPRVGAYGASKAAVHSIGETLQVELLGSGVSCTTIHPGLIESNITRIDNQGVFHPEQTDPRPAKFIFPTDKAARLMVKAIARRKKVYVFTKHGKILVFLGKYFPGLARKIAAKQI